ncbi:MAG: hypothetical protein HN842_06170 [Gammaproteobacteria bacterium]|jgi:cell division protein ZipA|nr:hypothetical protein [Gammaproteobacteria bacterium]MBT7307783.1 hypothetical protein [Gammaproteobacteria bacterium]
MGLLDTFKQVLERSEKQVKSVLSGDDEPTRQEQPGEVAEETNRETNRETGGEARYDRHDPIDLSGWPVDGEPALDLLESEDCGEPEPGFAGSSDDRSTLRPSSEEGSDNLLIVLTVIAEGEDAFEGGDLLREFNAAGLVLGRDGLFHAYPDGGSAHPVFSVCNVLNPGTFEEPKMMQLKTRGIALFFEVPCEHSGKMAFNTMVGAAHQLSLGLGGKVLDGERRPLSACALQRLQDQVHECEYRRELERKKSTL